MDVLTSAPNTDMSARNANMGSMMEACSARPGDNLFVGSPTSPPCSTTNTRLLLKFRVQRNMTA